MIEPEKLGAWSFIAGVVIVILVSLLSIEAGLVTTMLVLLGVIVGLLNVRDKDTTHFLVAVIALAAAGNANLNIVPLAGGQLQNILRNIGIFVAPAAVIVALKAIYEMASGK
ncbi:MAG: hypothetical protein HY051_01865 [Candidatus Aenigmarchaeota archaeon]|nr:hypothetical protein [Candidatus Aenigmarchaeota archaeon]